MKVFKFLFLLLFMASCAPVHVNYDYEKGTDFAQYKTYNYFVDMQTGLSDLDTKRLLSAIDVNLSLKGMSISKSPDFLINIKSNEYQEAQRSSVGLGVGGGGGNVGGGVSVGIPIGQSNVNRQITIDFVDKNKTGLFWQAMSESSFNPNDTPQQKEEKLNTIVSKILSEYPPSKN